MRTPKETPGGEDRRPWTTEGRCTLKADWQRTDLEKRWRATGRRERCGEGKEGGKNIKPLNYFNVDHMSLVTPFGTRVPASNMIL